MGRLSIKMAERSKRRGILHLNAVGPLWGISIVNNADPNSQKKETEATVPTFLTLCSRAYVHNVFLCWYGVLGAVVQCRI